MKQEIDPYIPKNNIRIITATSLFDGHDAAINIIRRVLQNTGAEIIHMGHNRTAKEIVEAAIQEDVHAIAISCYQGGHIEFFKYIVDLLKEKKADHIKIFGGGGGVIVPEEVEDLTKYGVFKIYTPEDGRHLGLQGIINEIIKSCDYPLNFEKNIKDIETHQTKDIARIITCIETSLHKKNEEKTNKWHKFLNNINTNKNPIIGITGTGGSGKSSLTDEILIRLLSDNPDIKVGIISIDPTRRKSGGALLGDRIRMNSLKNFKVYLRSMATRNSGTEISQSLSDAIKVLKLANFDLIIAETAGIGQGDAAITDLVDISIYVMTSDFGAASQLEKIDMLDFADLVIINKFDRQGAKDALRDVRKQIQRNKNQFQKKASDMPVYGTIANKFNDDGVTSLYLELLELLNKKFSLTLQSSRKKTTKKYSSSKKTIIPIERNRYLSEIANTIKKYHKNTKEQSKIIRKIWQIKNTLKHFSEQSFNDENLNDFSKKLQNEIKTLKEKCTNETNLLKKQWIDIKKSYSNNLYEYQVRNKKIKVPLFYQSLSGSKIPKVCIPKWKDPSEIYNWMRSENIPGLFPYTSGVFPFKRTDEDPTRMFAGEGDPFRTNRRFKYLSQNTKAIRLSTAFDAVTLFGCDPNEQPDIYGKVGNSGVSICTLDDIKILFKDFDLTHTNTSVSMTVNGPAPIILAFFFNAAIDQQTKIFNQKYNRNPSSNEFQSIKETTLKKIRGTIQADILKEDQGQNSCIFSTDFALRMMGDIQQYFIENNIKNFYSVSISGYHIAEAGANPITQLALTLANGFTYLEYYLSRGMKIDQFASNLSFFFSNGMDPEFTVIGRVARRIWAITLRNMYKSKPHSQKLKYHIQTSGRSLHSQDVNFNDIRTTLQALCAIYDNCNSLHTNAYDEAITTPSEESVRRALAIQRIINQEWGLNKNENSLQGSFIVNELTNLVEEAVLNEFKKLSSRGGVLGSMETGYQRSKIQEESLYYEHLKHTGELPIIGVNTFVHPSADKIFNNCNLELARATEKEKRSQLERLKTFHEKHKNESSFALKKLQKTALEGKNIFEELMETSRHCSLEQITQTLYQVGGMYRRGM